MGSVNRRIAYQQATAAGEEVERAKEGRSYSEEQLAAMEGLLGTEAQAAGELSTDSSISPYTSRYQVDEGALESLLVGFDNAEIQWNAITGNVEEANKLMEQAEAAARSGDLDTAAQLRAQAEGGLTRIGGMYDSGTGNPFGTAIQTIQNTQAQAEGALSSPMAQIVGGQVREAREFQDWDSQASRDYRRNMSESAMRAVDAGSRGAKRSARDLALARGSAQSPYAAQAVAAASEAGFAAQRAQILSDTNQSFDAMRRQFARDAVGSAREFLYGSAGIREEFQQSIERLSGLATQTYMQTAGMANEMAGRDRQKKMAEKANRQSIVHSLAGIALGGLTGGLGAFAGAPSILAGIAGGMAGKKPTQDTGA